jgi:ABC-type multidrug transport system ATPase subunit
MGPSGAGKTTFLSTLTDKMDRSCVRGGELHINGQHADLPAFRKVVGYVPQDDVMVRELSVWENIMHSARIRLPCDWSDHDVEAHVRAVVESMGLVEVSDSKIGDETHRCISGGQRKRVNIGMELAAAPLALFLDEPTSGLDSTAAMKVCTLLYDIAQTTGITVAMVIHQPRVEIWNHLDDILLLAPGGLTVYCGSQSTAQRYFEEHLRVIIGLSDNPADVIMDAIADHGDDYAKIWLLTGQQYLLTLVCGPLITIMEYTKQNSINTIKGTVATPIVARTPTHGSASDISLGQVDIPSPADRVRSFPISTSSSKDELLRGSVAKNSNDQPPRLSHQLTPPLIYRTWHESQEQLSRRRDSFSARAPITPSSMASLSQLSPSSISRVASSSPSTAISITSCNPPSTLSTQAETTPLPTMASLSVTKVVPFKTMASEESHPISSASSSSQPCGRRLPPLMDVSRSVLGMKISEEGILPSEVSPTSSPPFEGESMTTIATVAISDAVADPMTTDIGRGVNEETDQSSPTTTPDSATPLPTPVQAVKGDIVAIEMMPIGHSGPQAPPLSNMELPVTQRKRVTFFQENDSPTPPHSDAHTPTVTSVNRSSVGSHNITSSNDSKVDFGSINMDKVHTKTPLETVNSELRGASWIKQFYLCHIRALRQTYENLGGMVLEAGVAIIAGALMGAGGLAHHQVYYCPYRMSLFANGILFTT